MPRTYANIDRTKMASQGVDDFFGKAEMRASGKLRALLNAAAFGAVLLSTGCASVLHTPDREDNHDERTGQAALSYAVGSFAVSALLGGDTDRNMTATLGGALAGSIIALLENRRDTEFRQKIAESGLELYTVAPTEGRHRQGAIHIKIPGKHILGAGAGVNRQFMSALFDAAVWAPTKINQINHNDVTGMSLFYSFPKNSGMFTRCDTRQMRQAVHAAESWINGHHSRLNTGLRIGHTEALRSTSGATDDARLYKRVLMGVDEGASDEDAQDTRGERSACNEGEASIILTYKR